MVVAETFLLLAHNGETHEHLAKLDVVSGPLDLYRIRTANVGVATLSEVEKLSVTILRLVMI